LTSPQDSQTIFKANKKRKLKRAFSALLLPMPASSLAALRSQIVDDLRGRVLSPFNYRDRNVFELVSTGIPEIDATVGGLPRGAMTEICGPPCSGRTSFLLSALAARTTDGEACALVDARDSFDPYLASAAGVALNQLLWVRCQNADQALRATDLLIQGGGFGLVAVDLSDIAPKIVRYVPLNAWFRFRRAVEDTPTILLVMEQEANAKTCASLVLRMKAHPAQWSQAVTTPGPVRNLQNFAKHPFARLLKGFEIAADVVRSRLQPPKDVPPPKKNESAGQTAGHWEGTFETVVGAQDPCAPARQPTTPTKQSQALVAPACPELRRASLPAFLPRDAADENHQQGRCLYQA
jgi:recombination protein RecA